MALSLVGAVYAHAADLTWGNDTTVTVSGHNYTIKTGSAATSMQVLGTTLVVAVPASSSFTLVSPDKYVLTNDASILQSCGGSQNEVTVSGAQTVTFTLSSTTACTFNSGSGGDINSGGGGGGGGGGGAPYVPPVTTVTTTTTTPTTATISGCDSRTTGFSTVTGQSCSGNTTTVTTTVPVVIAGCNNGTTGFSTVSGVSCANNGASVSTTTSYNFGSVTLKNGSRGAAVMELQRFLNKFLNLGLVVDGKLGPKTIAVIKQWQKAHGLVADGLIGVKTKAMMNAEAGNN